VSPKKGDGQIDWPLLPLVELYRSDGVTHIGSTDVNGLIVFPLNHSVIDSCSNQATGLNTDWTTKAGKTCNNWKSSDNSVKQGVGWRCSTIKDLINGGELSCGSNRFFCVTLTPSLSPSMLPTGPSYSPTSVPTLAPFFSVIPLYVFSIQNYDGYIWSMDYALAFVGPRVAIIVDKLVHAQY
jgi:hypothetical protein